MSDVDTSAWSWDERMGVVGVESLGDSDSVTLADLRADMEIARQILVEAKGEFDRACDAVYSFVRAKRGESA